MQGSRPARPEYEMTFTLSVHQKTLQTKLGWIAIVNRPGTMIMVTVRVADLSHENFKSSHEVMT